ncbi:MAG TPA: cytochrome c [Methylomirabilota bacterium]|nr:cytochrome c [Methylomirabilota bacterium]
MTRSLLFFAAAMAALTPGTRADDLQGATHRGSAEFEKGFTNVASVEVHETLHGHFVYMKNCVFCHGKRGDGKGEMGLTVQPPPRDFGAGIFKYHSTPGGSLPTNDDLTRTVREGIADTAMPAFAALPQRDVQAVIEYVKTFSPKWRQPENYAAPIAIPKRPQWFDDAKEFARHAENGRSLYAVSCAPCHGAKGDGIGGVTNLVDSWGHPAVARDLRLPYLRRGRQLEDIYRVLVIGLDGTPMPSFAEGTTEEQRWELVAFIEQLRRENREHRRE